MADTGEHWGAGVVFTAPRLASLHFEVDGELDLNLEEIPTEFKLRVGRLSQLELFVEFGVEIVEIHGLTGLCIYRAEFSLKEGSPEAANAEEAFRSLAARLAPTLLYPFVREALHSAAARAHLPSIVAPIVNFSGVFDSASVEIPAPPEDANAQGDI
jgi:hypothetical protein